MDAERGSSGSDAGELALVLDDSGFASGSIKLGRGILTFAPPSHLYIGRQYTQCDCHDVATLTLHKSSLCHHETPSLDSLGSLVDCILSRTWSM